VPAATALPPAAAPAMLGAHRRWRLAAIGGGVVVLGVVAILLVLQWSAQAASADGSFTVRVPSGWERFTGTSLPDGTTTKNELMVLLGPTRDGVQAHVFIYPHQAGYVDLGQLDRSWSAGLDQATCHFSGAVGHFSRMRPSTVGGAPALLTDCRTPAVSVEFITVNRANRTYMIGFSAASSQFAQQRDGSLHDVLASWQWH
jgi:hypothetical protein